MNILKKYFSNIYIPIAWSLIILILLTLPGSMLPDEGSFKIPSFDKIVHIGLFGGFVFLWCLYYSFKNISQKRLLMIFFWIFIIACSYGIGMEYVQKYFIPSREFELGDMIADMIGSGIAYGIGNITLSGAK
jgi:VanZ family protein